MLITIKDYCDKRNVTRQYVYQEIKKGKFKAIELPVFVRYEGEEKAIGTQKFLELPTTHIGIEDTEQYSNILADLATEDIEIKQDLCIFLKSEGKAKSLFADFLHEKYNPAHPKHESYEQARKKILQLWIEEVKQLKKDVIAIKAEV